MNNKIKSIRIKKGISQNKLANLVGVTRQYMSEIENEKKIPSIKIALLISKNLKKPVEEIFFTCGDDSK